MLFRSRSSALALVLAMSVMGAAAPAETPRPPASAVTAPVEDAPRTGYFVIELQRADASGYHIATLLRAPAFDSTRRDANAVTVSFAIRAFEVMDVQLLNDGRMIGGTLRFTAAELKRVQRTLVNATSQVSFRYRFAGEMEWHESPVFPAIDEYTFTISRNGVLAHLNSP